MRDTIGARIGDPLGYESVVEGFLLLVTFKLNYQGVEAVNQNS
jgi:hypothetical protein